MKRGFTLAEILISVGIIGVVAALMLPMVNKYKPDENKIRFLQTYTTIMEIMPGIVNNKDAYPLMSVYGITATVYDEYPLMNVNHVVNIDGTDYSGTKKICRLLAMGLNTTGSINCTDNYNANILNETFSPSFKSVNGVEYLVQTYLSGNSYRTEVMIDVNGSGNGANCYIVNEGCREPDRFLITIGPDGQVNAGDSMGKEHLKTRTNWKLNRDKTVVGNMYYNTVTATLEKFMHVSEGLLIPDPQPVPSQLRKTLRKGIYCTKTTPYIHYFWSKDYNVWVELDDVSHVGADDGPTYEPYSGAGAGDIGGEPSTNAW